MTMSDEAIPIDDIPLPIPAPEIVADASICAARHGLVGEITAAIAPETEADPNAVPISLLVCVGNAIGRRPYFQVEGDQHHTNLFACLVGDSARVVRARAWAALCRFGRMTTVGRPSASCRDCRPARA